MRNEQLRKTNNELTLKKNFFLANNKWGTGEKLGLYIYVYTPLFSRFWCYFTNFSEF